MRYKPRIMELCPRFTQRLPLDPKSKKRGEDMESICCGEFDIYSGIFVNEGECEKLGWSPDERENRVRDYWISLSQDDDIILPNEGTHPRGYMEFRVKLFDKSRLVWVKSCSLGGDVRNVYNTSLGSLSDAVVFGRGDDQYEIFLGDEGMDRAIPKPPGYVPSLMSIGSSSGCGVCPEGYYCSDKGACTAEAPEEANGDLPIWAVVVMILAGIFLISLIIMYLASNRPRQTHLMRSPTSHLDLSL